MTTTWRGITKALATAPALDTSFATGGWLMPRSLRNYKRDVGDGLSNSIVVATVNWISRSFPEAYLQVKQRQVDGGWEAVEDHPLIDLVEVPNPRYSGSLLWWATLSDFNTTGNAYWLKVRSRSGTVVQLWYAPASLVEPHAHPTEFIDYYEYRVGGQVLHVDSADIVHFRYGLDPRNPRKGVSPLASLLREIFTDDEAANFSASVLANMGVPGVVIAPKGGGVSGGGGMQLTDLESIKQEFVARFGGDRRGEPMVLSGPTDVQVISWAPQQMDMKVLRRVPEERVSAVLGVSAMVVGLGAGLDRSTFSNYAEARSAAWENNLIPTQRMFGEELRAQLLPDFEDDEAVRHGWRVGFDNSRVRALADNQQELTMRARVGVMTGIMTVGEGRDLLSLPVDETHDVYLRTPVMVPVPVAEGNKPIQQAPALGPAAGPGVDAGGGYGGGPGVGVPELPKHYATLDIDLLERLREPGVELRTRVALPVADIWLGSEIEVGVVGLDAAATEVPARALLRSYGEVGGVVTLAVVSGG